MKPHVNNFRDAIFLVIEENSCPLYNVGEELKVEKFGLSISSFKPGCLIMAKKITEIVSSKESLTGIPAMGTKKTRFDCGGCDGLIQFEYKKDKDFATLQMKLLNETEQRRKKKHLDQFFGVLRNLPIFDSLDDDSLSDLTLLLELKTIPHGKIVAKKGSPGSHLYIILKGNVEVKNEDGTKMAELGTGEIFGEMSLLSGEPLSHSIYTGSITQLALLSVKNFKDVLRKYPVLQLFLFKLLIDRAQTMTLQSGTITSGMTGELEEIATVDLFQLINSSQKTGIIELTLEKGKALVFFKEGEIIYARFLTLRNKDALFSILSEKQGRFSYTKGIPHELDTLQPIGGFMAMMMEGLQNIDEKQE